LKPVLSRLVLPAFVGILLTVGFCGYAAIQAPSKQEAMKTLTSLRDQNTTRLKEIDQALRKKLDESQMALKVGDLDNDIEKLRAEKRELSLRQDFLDRLTFQFDVKYTGTEMKEFMTAALRSMAKVEVESTREHNIWKFLNYLSLTIAKIPGGPDRVLAFVEGYMKQTSIESPIKPEDYLAKMAYENGTQSEAAHPMAKTEVGEFADKRLRQIAVPQLRTKTPAPTAQTP
jgi:hypothetical protein